MDIVGSSLSLFLHCLITQLVDIVLRYRNSTVVSKRAFSFANRCIDAWNSLDNDVLCASSLRAFKRRLCMCKFTKFLYVL